MVALAVYDQCFADAQAMATTHIAAVLQSHFGLSAMHPGIAPAQWPQPGGQSSMGYWSSYSGMLTHCEILEKAELCHLKSVRELNLHHCIVNMTYQAFCHCCSDNYCWQKYALSVPFDPQQHTNTGQI